MPNKKQDYCKNGHDMSVTRSITTRWRNGIKVPTTSCGECVKQRKKQYVYGKELKRKWKLKHVYGLDYDPRVGAVCAICGNEPNGVSLHVDHNHETGKVRGVLCGNCNRGIGMFKTIPNLQSAINYLTLHSKENTDVKKSILASQNANGPRDGTN